MKLSPHSLTPGNPPCGIRSLNGFGNLSGPLALSVLYLRKLFTEASPKAISGRTSYLRVRLAFHPYPQFIPCLFNDNVVRASTGFYSRFTLTMDRSPGFGSAPYDLNRPIKTRFRCGSALFGLTSPHNATRRSVLQKVRCQAALRHGPPTVRRHHGFRFYFTPRQGFFSPFPHGTCALSVAG